MTIKIIDENRRIQRSIGNRWGMAWLMAIIALYVYVLAFDNQNAGKEKAISHKESISASTISPMNSVSLYKKTKVSIFTLHVYEQETEKLVAEGTGVAIRKDMIATNCHVALASDYFTVLVGEKEVKGELFSEKGDLCIVYLPGQNLIPVEIRLSAEAEVGEDVYAVGNPDGIQKSISKGILSKKDVIYGGITYIQSDAAIASGSSGGGLFDSKGRLIGITSAVPRDAENLALAIPTEEIYSALTSPALPKPKSIKSSSSHEKNKLIKIGSYGGDGVGLYSFGKMYFMVFNERNNVSQENGLIIWVPDMPRLIFVIPHAENMDDAFKYLARMILGEGELMRTRDFLILDDQGYPLLIDKTIKGYNNIRVAKLDFDPSRLLVDGKFVMTESVDSTTSSGYRNDYYGLLGFREAATMYLAITDKENNSKK